MRRLVSWDAHATLREAREAVKKKVSRLFHDIGGSRAFSVMGPPDKKVTDGVCALWEKE
jgi:hypothetical protein